LILAAEYDDANDREFFDDVPTYLNLDDEAVGRLIQIGRRMLPASQEFRSLVTDMGGILDSE